MRDDKKRIEIIREDKQGNVWFDKISFTEAEKIYGKIPFYEKLINKIISIKYANIRNGVLNITVQNGSYKESLYTMENIHGTWGNITKHV